MPLVPMGHFRLNPLSWGKPSRHLGVLVDQHTHLCPVIPVDHLVIGFHASHVALHRMDPFPCLLILLEEARKIACPLGILFRSDFIRR